MAVVSKEKTLESWGQLDFVVDGSSLVCTNHILLLFASRKQDSLRLAYNHPL